MKERILLLIKAKNYTAAQFADEIGVQKSGVSHILSGRNNPSLDFVQKILTRFPEISNEWLLFGKGPMMVKDIPATFKLPPVDEPSGHTQKIADLFSQELPQVEPVFNIQETHESDQEPGKNLNPENDEKIVEKDAKILTGDDNVRPDSKPFNIQGESRKIEKLIVIYTDKTFVEYKPES